MIHDDFFVSLKLLAHCGQRATLSRKKKLAVQLQCTEKKLLEIVGLGKHIESLSVNELDSLLAWHQVPKTTGAKKADKLKKWKAIFAGGQPPPLIDQWSDEDEQRLLAVMLDKVNIMNTHYGHKLALKERELGAPLDKLNEEKRQELRQKLDKLDVESAQSAIKGSIATAQAPMTASAYARTGAA
jgi:hypothetical protein